MRPQRALYLPIAALSFASAVLGESSRSAEQAAADGTRLLAAGSYSDAARAYTEAIGGFWLPGSASRESDVPDVMVEWV